MFGLVVLYGASIKDRSLELVNVVSQLDGLSERSREPCGSWVRPARFCLEIKLERKRSQDVVFVFWIWHGL